MQYLATRFLLMLLVLSVSRVAIAQRMPEPQMDQEPFDRIDVELLIKNLESSKFAEREKAERELKSMLTTSGYPLWHFLMNVDAQGRGLAETRMRLGKILQVIRAPDGDEFVFKDWEGNPLPNVLCEVFTMKRINYIFDKDYAELLGRTFSDEQGRVRLPDLTAARDAFPGQQAAPQKPTPALGVVVYAPDYGVAGAVLTKRKPEVFFSLVKDGTKPALRAARGVVVDEAGQPVEGAAIKTGSIQIPGQGGYNVRGESVVFTDHKGRYRVYGWPYNTENKLVPVGSEFSLQISCKDLFPRGTRSSNDAPKKIVLQRGKRFHRFRFVDEKIDASTYSPVVLYSEDKASRTRAALPESLIKNGGMLLPGTYTASFHDARGYSAKYEPIVVDAASPEQLTFKLPPAKTFSGIVYDGTTGDPVSGAIVFAAYSSKSKHLVDITDEQLASLAAVSTDEMKDHPTTAALREVKGLKAITKTDEDGRYAVSLGPADEVYGLYTVGAGKLPYEVRAVPADESKEGENPIVLHDMFHFPAARVRFTPQPPEGTDKDQRILLWPEWKIDDEAKQPDWFSRFSDAKKARHGLPGFSPSFYWVNAGRESIGKTQMVTVPADIELRLMVRSSERSGGFAPVCFSKVRLSAGEVKELGQVDLKHKVPVLVRVVDHNGNPLEGVAVRHKYTDSDSWQVGKTTNIQGEVAVPIAVGLPGQFGARDIRGPKGRLRDENLKVSFNIDEAAGVNTYTIRLTKEQSGLLPKEGAE